MNTIVLSDTALLGFDYEDTREGILRLQQLQKSSCKLILLSNRPELCMRKIGAYVGMKNEVSYRYLGACDTKGNGVDVIMHNEDGYIDSFNIKADFTIFGNGISTFDGYDNLIHQGRFISKEILNRMINELRKNGYVSYGEYISLRKGSLGARCFNEREDVYKFFTPKIGSDKITDDVYGMQCSARSVEENNHIIELIEQATPEMIGYILNGKPCFYQREVNKLTALNNIFNNHSINPYETVMILSEVTDDVVLEEYGMNSYAVGDISHKDIEQVECDSLAKVLRKIM